MREAVTGLRVCRFQQAELVHARTAMVGVAGILIPDVRVRTTPLPRSLGAAWLRVIR